jgi:hypothetical protein
MNKGCDAKWAFMGLFYSVTMLLSGASNGKVTAQNEYSYFSRAEDISELIESEICVQL